MSAAGAPPPHVVHFATDHPYSDHRIALQQTVTAWLAQMPKVSQVVGATAASPSAATPRADRTR